VPEVQIQGLRYFLLAHPHETQAYINRTYLKASSPLYKLCLSLLDDRKSLNIRRARDFWTILQKGVWKIIYCISSRVKVRSIPAGKGSAEEA
jgi:hypothetical protein